mmetsp:Transcript_24170/g.60378  ORF Transcript_24170/g.60378 Transcript_24170/m.60378 type:complete len:299 (-) Transcript_24170:463-1359(-)
MCFVDKPSLMVAKPETNSSMVSSPVLLTSSVSHACIKSSGDTGVEDWLILLITSSLWISVSNSSLSRRPFPSASACTNASRRKAKKAFCSSACAFFMASSRPMAPSTTFSEATAVKMEIMVQEATQMKMTKKPCQRTSKVMTGWAMSIQLSSVVTWNKENIEVGMFWKCSWMPGNNSSTRWLLLSKPSPCPRSCVQKMPQASKKNISTPKTTANDSIMALNAVTKAINCLTTLKSRSSRNKRSNLNTRSADEMLKSLLRRSWLNNTASQDSMTPSTTIRKSSQFHSRSRPKKNDSNPR